MYPYWPAEKARFAGIFSARDRSSRERITGTGRERHETLEYRIQAKRAIHVQGREWGSAAGADGKARPPSVGLSCFFSVSRARGQPKFRRGLKREARES
jgi:hypothetical protein